MRFLVGFRTPRTVRARRSWCVTWTRAAGTAVRSTTWCTASSSRTEQSARWCWSPGAGGIPPAAGTRSSSRCPRPAPTSPDPCPDPGEVRTVKPRFYGCRQVYWKLALKSKSKLVFYISRGSSRPYWTKARFLRPGHIVWRKRSKKMVTLALVLDF